MTELDSNVIHSINYYMEVRSLLTTSVEGGHGNSSLVSILVVGLVRGVAGISMNHRGLLNKVPGMFNMFVCI